MTAKKSTSKKTTRRPSATKKSTVKTAKPATTPKVQSHITRSRQPASRWWLWPIAFILAGVIGYLLFTFARDLYRTMLQVERTAQMQQWGG